MVKIKTVFFLCSLSLLTQCAWHPYQSPIQQGNVMADAKVDQLHEGMTQEQVRFLLGTPVLEPPFDNNTWNYVHTDQKGNSFKATTERLTLTFKKGHLARIKKVPTFSSH